MQQSSVDTDTTQVSTRLNSTHMDPLEEKHTNMSLDPNSRDSQATPNGSTSRQQNDDTSDLGFKNDDTDKDIEKGDTSPQPTSTQNPRDPNLVEFNGPDDPENPMNWPRSKKYTVTIAMGFMTFCVTFASSVFSNATEDVAALYHVSDEVSVLGTSLFVLGFAVGPLVWGPGSEIFGRKLPLFIGYFLFAIFQIPVAVAQNIETIMLCRFFGGAFASAPLAIVGGALADFWGPVDRGIAVCVFACATFVGPIAGPIMGGFITESYLGWRWTAWITLIMAAFFGTVGFFLVPESSQQKILQTRAKKLRFETQNWATHSQLDTKQVGLKSIIHTYLFKPFQMLILEPILLLVSLYMSLIYGILYLFFEAYPISFQEQRGWSQGVGALPFLSIMVGVLCGAATIVWLTKTRFARKLAKNGRVVPEERLPPMILGAILLPIGLFWFAWTSSPHISWVPQVLSGALIGWGILMVFLQGINYIIDVYMWNANSAIAANTFCRSFAGAGFPLFATYMYDKLGVDWATSLLGFLCIAMIPAPIAFYLYGKKIRAMSKFSPDI